MFDLAVIGAGPAGGAAAIEGARLGLSVVVFDEQAAAGGQVWRAKGPAILSAPASPESRAGDDLRTRLAGSGAELRFGARVWQMAREGGGWRLHVGAEAVEARA
ncbi:MAG: FAD-dependent oxidoreductase, partial [Pseudomonadota bacterium]